MRWKNDRIRKSKERAKRHAAEAGQARQTGTASGAASTAAAPAPAPAPASTES